MHTDTKFFTNTDTDSLLGRFRTTLLHARYFDVLVGYFRASGFSLLAEPLGNVEKIRILVGLNADAQIVQATHADGPLPFFPISHDAVQKNYALAVQEEMEKAPERQETEDSIALFSRYIQEGKIEIKGHPSRDIHAKVYITRYKEGGTEYGNVITGSSNFSFSGLSAQREFNVELKDKSDVDFALSRFELLWSEGVTLTGEFVATVTQKTWLNDTVQPYELYLKFIYEYFKEDINIDESPPPILPDGFIDLEYQRQAVIAAGKILSAYGGVFLADVVGLGKTFISAMLLQQLQSYKLIICPPVLKRYWEESLRQFHVTQYKVYSAGKLEELTESIYSKYKYVLIDESHRFRNENTQGYEKLKKICLGKKIILVSATPLNNRLGDILAQIKLFQPGRRSTIPGVPDLEAFFRQRDKELRKLVPGTPEYKEASERAAALVRDKVLKYVMIRRTRGEVTRYFSTDITNQGLRFPILAPPVTLTYQFDSAIENAFQTTISLLQTLKYARYTPLLYLKRGATEQEKISQGNARGFIKSILVKRLESSFYAFGRTIERIISSYQAFLQAYNLGSVFIGKSIDIVELFDVEDSETLDEILSRKGVEQYPAKYFAKALHTDLVHDLATFHKVSAIWKYISDDPKFTAFLTSVTTDPRLQNERLIVFTESQETAQYLYSRLESDMPGISMRFSSKGGMYGKQTLTGSFARDFIQANFDPSHAEPKSELRILITTDVLAEGMNLHRAGRIINYDLPWNPTRVMQRVGRINRVGTEYHDIYLFNFFPTAQSDAHLGLEANIIKKIDAFNIVLGNDSQYIYEDETPDPHGLFGEQLVKRLSSLTDEGNEEDSELKYLQIIRQLRDNTPDVFRKIKNLPVKARSAHDESQQPDNLLVFFREGVLKKFVLVGQETHELTFLEAALLMSCTPTAARMTLPNDYYERLKTARGYLEESLEAKVLPMVTTLNVKTRRLLEIIRALQRHSSMADDDQEYLQRLYETIEQAAIARKTITTLQNICNRQHLGPVGLVNAMRNSMPLSILVGMEEKAKSSHTVCEPKQIILAQYLASKGISQ